MDEPGRLLAAAVADHPGDGGPAWEFNFIAVSRTDCTTGARWAGWS